MAMVSRMLFCCARTAGSADDADIEMMAAHIREVLKLTVEPSFGPLQQPAVFPGIVGILELQLGQIGAALYRVS